MRGALATIAAFAVLAATASAAGGSAPSIFDFHVTAGEHATFVSADIYSDAAPTSYTFMREWSPCHRAGTGECPAVAFIEETRPRELGAVHPSPVRLEFRAGTNCEYTIRLWATNAYGTVGRGTTIITPGPPAGRC